MFSHKPTWLIEWLCSLAGTVKVKKMKLYLTGIKSYQLDLGIECAAFLQPRLERTIQGIKRDPCEPEQPIRTPLTRPFLLRILQYLSATDYGDIVLSAAFALAFAGFLRVGEFTYTQADRNLGRAFPKWFLSKSSIKMHECGRYMEVTLPASKTDPFRKGIELTIAASRDPACPVQLMKQFLTSDTHRSSEQPLFCIGRDIQQAFTRDHVVLKFQQLALQAGLGHGTWNGHSFRRGAATWAAQVGLSETGVQTLGHWRSDAYKTYIEYSNQQRISLSKRFQVSQGSAS